MNQILAETMDLGDFGGVVGEVEKVKKKNGKNCGRI